MNMRPNPYGSDMLETDETEHKTLAFWPSKRKGNAKSGGTHRAKGLLRKLDKLKQDRQKSVDLPSV